MQFTNETPCSCLHKRHSIEPLLSSVKAPGGVDHWLVIGPEDGAKIWCVGSLAVAFKAINAEVV